MNMRFISRGTPGRKNAVLSPSCTAKPGAVPLTLGSISLPAGMSACFARPGFIALPKDSTRRRIARSALSSRTSSTPAARAAAAAVRSSVVGPSPPVAITSRALAASRRIAPTTESRGVGGGLRSGHAEPCGGELGGEPGSVGVDNLATSELGADRQQGDGHRGPGNVVDRAGVTSPIVGFHGVSSAGCAEGYQGCGGVCAAEADLGRPGVRRQRAALPGAQRAGGAICIGAPAHLGCAAR